MSTPPEGECTCLPGNQVPCDYCHEMTMWAHEEMYGDEEREIEARRERESEADDDDAVGA